MGVTTRTRQQRRRDNNAAMLANSTGDLWSTRSNDGKHWTEDWHGQIEGSCVVRIALKPDRNEREMKVQSCSKRVPNEARRSSSAPTHATALGSEAGCPWPPWRGASPAQARYMGPYQIPRQIP